MADRLDAALSHRGPDGAGRYRDPDGRALLVHRRLAIIDPSTRSGQPMSTIDGRFHLTYNGEIYNYRALRAALEARGVRLSTTSDTEVLLHLLALDGPAALAHLRGMFALALWDALSGTLLLSRDRFGIKPLYVSVTSEQVTFASELTALRRAGGLAHSASAAGILAFLSWSSIPTPLTWLEGAGSLEPGTWQRWHTDGRRESGVFADAREAYAGTGEAVPAAELRERISAAVRDSVHAHLVSDVPVGVFLSGGIDSGAIVSTARQAGASDLHTYTVVVDEDTFSEEEMAQSVAQRFGTLHHTLRVSAADILRDLDAIVPRLDQPTGDAVNSYYVSQAVAATGIKAVLSGLGGDEMFGGYPSFRRLPLAAGVGRTLAPVMPLTGGVATAVLPVWRAEKWKLFAADPSLSSGYRALRGLFMPDEITLMAGEALRDQWSPARSAVAGAERRIFEPSGDEEPVASVARMETRGFLGSQLLRDVDAVAMAHGLEVRTPFVDHELQQAVWPALAGHRALWEHKRVLSESLPDPLPEGVVSQPKRGFTLPFDRWMRGPLGPVVQEGLQVLVAERWVNAGAVAHVWDAWQQGDAHWSRPWALGVLGRFLGAGR